jgi:hypothetical protein
MTGLSTSEPRTAVALAADLPSGVDPDSVPAVVLGDQDTLCPLRKPATARSPVTPVFAR